MRKLIAISILLLSVVAGSGPAEAKLTTDFNRWLLPLVNDAIQFTFQRLKCGPHPDIKAVKYEVKTFIVTLEGTAQEGPLLVRGPVMILVGNKAQEFTFEIMLVKPETRWVAEEAWLVDIISNGVLDILTAKCPIAAASLTDEQQLDYFGWRFTTDRGTFEKPYTVDF